MESDHSSRFSPSKLDTYRDCPRRYRYRYLDKLRVDSQSVEAFLGSCVHSAFEALYEGLMHGRRASLQESLAVYEKAWDEGFGERIVIRGEKYSAQDWREVGRECVRSYYRDHEPFDRGKTVAVEKKVGFELEVDGHPYRIEGYVDRLSLAEDGVFEIHDYKTSGTLPAQADKEKDWQLPIYEIAVRQAWPDAAGVRLVWHFVRFGKAITVTTTAERRAEVKEEIAQTILAIKSDHEFAPRQSALCDWCEYRSLCPLWSHPERVDGLPPESRRQDDGVKLADQFASIELKKKELREQLRRLEKEQSGLQEELFAYAAASGISVVAASEGVIALEEREETKFPVKSRDPERLESLERELKGTPLWSEISHFDAGLLMEGYKKKRWPREWLSAAEGIIGRYARRVVERTARFKRRKEPDGEA